MRGFKSITCIYLICLSLVVSAFAIFSTTNNSEAVLSDETLGFVVKDFDGKVAIYSSGADIPFDVTGIETKNLPKADRNSLINGIYLADKDELAMILEDFGS